ncbi:MAG: ParB/RepB/Spo0J family partition protein [Oscillospiraceae bacterium]|jgi:ParB family chromosome partitioning protein|nr:ParB/RepB/Spo0J family partition protein [Oscillospiraceae bacterium]
MKGLPKRKEKAGVVLQLPVREVQPSPHQPRRAFHPEELQSLADSIRSNGILQPLTVRQLQTGRYELVAGERRLRAAGLAGLERVPCLLMEISDERSAVLALVENIQRADLGFFEEAEAIARLIETCGYSQEQAARELGRAPSTLSNKLRLLKLPQALRTQIAAAGLTERHARALLRVEDPARQAALLDIVVARSLTVQQTDQLIDTALRKPIQKQKPPVRLVRDVRLFVNSIRHAVETMRASGIAAVSESAENDTHYIYTVRIPKATAVASRRTG